MDWPAPTSRFLRQGRAGRPGFGLSALLVLTVLLVAGDAFPQSRPLDELLRPPVAEEPRASDVRSGCWKRPTPSTLEEAFKTAGNKSARGQQQRVDQREVSNAVLLMSNTMIKAAYSGGLLIGWGETGGQPRFAAITAVGASALIAPFLFLGPTGNQQIADFFNCDAGNLAAIAERAASYLDEGVLAAIAREHDAGRRLLIGLPGSAAREEVVWDMGVLARSGDPRALGIAQNVMRAAVDLYSVVDPKDGPPAAGQVVPRNRTFRLSGAGQEFLLPPRTAQDSAPGRHYFIIHNDRLFEDDSGEYIKARLGKGDVRAPPVSLVPGYDVARNALAGKGVIHFASTKSASGLTPLGKFDFAYIKALFNHAYRQGRMGKEWVNEFPGLSAAAARQIGR